MGENSRGFPGYIASRPIAGSRVPQHVQNIVIRDYAKRAGLRYKLSGTEYAMADCYMMLEQLLDEIGAHDGFIAYSMFMLPEDPASRRRIYERVLAAGASLHAAAEQIALYTRADASKWEDIFLVNQFAAKAPPAL